MNADAVTHLRRADKVLARLIKKVGPCTLAPKRRRAPFQALVQSVTYQQLNGTAAATILRRVLALYPNLIVSSLDPAWSLTLFNASSSEKTLKIMTWIALLGMPFVLSYTAIIYWVFRGKVELGKFSY